VRRCAGEMATDMSERRYPNESPEYRAARDALLAEEQELVDKVKAVAAKRRELPPGGGLKEDYVFQWAIDGKVGERVKFSELFGDKTTLLVYSFMFGPSWDNPCRRWRWSPASSRPIKPITNARSPMTCSCR
jgi:predicted dithiol-disulfide oxidoreductase (DUF899 family)